MGSIHQGSSASGNGGNCQREAGQLAQKEDRHRGRQVQIGFYPENNEYRIKDLGIGLGAYMRIEHDGEPYVLRNNQIINVGSTLLLVSLMDALD